MKYLKGFKKNYFSLSAIVAYSTAKKLCDNEIYSKKSDQFSQLYLEEEDEAPPLDELIAIESSNKALVRPCHCDCFF